MKIFAAFIVILFLSSNISAQGKKIITLEDVVVNQIFSQKSVSGLRSMNDGLYYSTSKNNNSIVKHSYKTGEEVSVILDLGSIEDAAIHSFSDYEFSEDETKILLTTRTEPIYRHSFTAEYYVWNSVTEELLPVSSKGRQQLATFSPDGERIAFVRDNNLFIKNLKFGTESQVTFDGEKNKIINGAPDWVYEEEFSFNKAFAWSPDSEFLAYLRFDETLVKEFGMTLFKGEKPTFDEYGLYPYNEVFKYPKAGEANSVISVQVYDLKSKTALPVDIGEEADIYIPRIKWTPDANNLVVLRLNRRQNQLDVLYANPYTGDSRPIFTEKNKRYIDESFYDKMVFLEDGSFVVNSERDGWSHLYLYDKQGFEKAQITKGEFDVTDFYGYDPVQKVFYYQAAAKSPLQREVYFLSLDGKKKGELSTSEGTNNVLFSKNYKYYINYFSSAKNPYLITLSDLKGKNTRVLEDNTELIDNMKEYKLAQKEFFTFSTSEGIDLNGYMMKPLNFDPTQQYPVFMTQYSGPNSQSCTDSWQNPGWEHFLAQEGFLVVCVDPRGTAARGEDFRKCTYLQLGKYESDDQVEAAKYLATLPYVDKNNISIFGWSYGGFMTALALEKGGSLFKAGVSVAPVTSWRFYDSIYTERYMRTPNENPDGYDDNSPLSHAEDIKGRLLLIHGSADDNVHVQNTMEFTEKMVQANVQFEMAIYTNRNHGIRGGNTTRHLYTKMTNFLKDQLQ